MCPEKRNRRKKNMSYKTFFIILITPLLLVGCDFFEPKSKTATIYRNYVGPGKAVMTLVTYGDEYVFTKTRRN